MNKIIPIVLIGILLVLIVGVTVGRLNLQDSSSLGAGAPVNRLSGAATIAGTNITTSSTAVLTANGGRAYALLVNDSDTDIYCALGTAAVINQGFRLNQSGGSYEIKTDNLYVGAINCIHAGSGNKVLTSLEI